MRLQTAPATCMPSEAVIVEPVTSSCQDVAFGISSTLPVAEPRPSVQPVVRALFAGLFMTLAQIVVAIALLAPEGPLSYRYSTLLQHDSFWFMNIVNRGYETTVPPINHKVMEVSNTAFFPAYPMMAATLRYAFRLESDNALLLAAQAAAFGFWCYFFLFCERWGLSPTLRFFGALSIVAHPAAFFLIAGYSESLFLMALLGFIYWSSSPEGGRTKFWAALHGILMSGTRIVGIPCAAFPVVRSIFLHPWKGMGSARVWLRQHLSAVVLMFVATMGAGL